MPILYYILFIGLLNIIVAMVTYKRVPLAFTFINIAIGFNAIGYAIGRLVSL